MTTAPYYRPRRLRDHPVLRDTIAEVSLGRQHLMLPMFVADVPKSKEIQGMPGVLQRPVEELAAEVERLVERGMRSFILFGVPQAKDPRAAGALDPGGVVPRAIGERGNISVTSYNRVLLLTGEVPTEEDRAKAGAAAARIENVRAVLNELAVMPNASINQITADSITTGKVKAAFLDTSQLQVSSIKVVTERGTVYLLGRVTEAEAARAAEVTRGVGGVRKVVKVFEIITPAQLAAMPAPPQPATKAASGAGK